MKIKQDQVEKVCRMALEGLKEKKMIKLKAPERVVFDAMVSTVLKNFDEENQIDQKAHELLEETLSTLPEDVDRQKMYMLIKRKLAKDRGFVL